MNAKITDYAGSCHCRAIGFIYRTAALPEDWAIRACQCSFCRAHDALSASDPQGELEFLASIAAKLQRYRFGLKTADFLLCKHCGVYIGAQISTKSGDYGIINTHALQDRPLDLAAATAIAYDGEDLAGRVLRREQRWTPLRRPPG